MNYLAHLYFSDPYPLAWAGSLMGDFHKGSDFSGLPEELVRHLRLHRYIDGLTQKSHAFQASRRRLDPIYRYARSVLVDVFYDHLLACNWNSYAQQELSEFAQEVYDGLEECHAYLSPDLQRQLPKMKDDDWLTAYRRPHVVKRVLGRLEQRLGYKIPLESAFPQLALLRSELETDFSTFMFESQKKVECWKQQH